MSFNEMTLLLVNTLRPRQNGRHFPDDIFKCIFLNENTSISIKISLRFVHKGPINNIPAMVRMMAWRRIGDKPLSEPMMVSLPTHICVTRPQWVNCRGFARHLICYSEQCHINIELHVRKRKSQMTACQILKKCVSNFVFSTVLAGASSIYSISERIWSWHHDMETLPALLTLCVGNPPITSNVQHWWCIFCKTEILSKKSSRVDGDFKHHDAHVTSV